MRRPAAVLTLLVALAAAAAVIASGSLAAPRAAAGRGASTRAGAHAPHAKRGIASSTYLATDPAKLAGLHAAWDYDWSATAPPGSAVPWVPMTWGAGSVTSASISALTADHRSGRARYLLGFNEPDSASQSNMTPAQAAALWPQLESTGLILGSPAPAVPSDGWLAQFMALARAQHLRVNFIALHYYQDVTNPDAIASLRSQLIAIHRQYGLPIWITELGAIDLRSWGEQMHSAISVPAVTTYMRRVFAMLDGLPFVARYAWFTDACTAACSDGSLLNRSGGLTAAGHTFVSAP